MSRTAGEEPVYTLRAFRRGFLVACALHVPGQVLLLCWACARTDWEGLNEHGSFAGVVLALLPLHVLSQAWYSQALYQVPLWVGSLLLGRRVFAMGVASAALASAVVGIVLYVVVRT